MVSFRGSTIQYVRTRPACHLVAASCACSTSAGLKPCPTSCRLKPATVRGSVAARRLGGALQVSYAGGSRRDHPAIRYYPPSGGLYFDVLTRLGEAARFETVDREVKEIEGIRVSVATPAALYRLKKDTCARRTVRMHRPCASDSIRRIETD